MAVPLSSSVNRRPTFEHAQHDGSGIYGDNLEQNYFVVVNSSSHRRCLSSNFRGLYEVRFKACYPRLQARAGKLFSAPSIGAG